jgi:hypothetical protein
MSLTTLLCLAATLHVGPNFPFPSLSSAIAVVTPGDTIEIHEGIYAGGQFFENVKGTADQWITIRGAAGENAVFEGGTNAIHFVEPAYLHLKNITFQHQTGNGLNTDDGGTYDTPTHHIVYESCTFKDMAATGNNDLLKLSGLDFFEIRNCTFINGAAGGSGIDMVGCHYGLIQGNRFENLGSNAIQCKGGTQQIRIEANAFKNAGARALNLGGSTGLAFFRPDTAHYEAANLQVYSNVFTGSEAPIAYVGSVNVDVANNTFYLPGKWVIRILQETVDPDRFVSCGDNFFRNNIIYLGNLPTETNIGPNTRPESFTFRNNLWFNYLNSTWSGPDIPVPDPFEILNQDPLLANAAAGNFDIPGNSPAAAAGQATGQPERDFHEQLFASPPSVGAVEANPVSNTSIPQQSPFGVFPNPFSEFFYLSANQMLAREFTLEIYRLDGCLLLQKKLTPDIALHEINAANMPAGPLMVVIHSQGQSATLFAKIILKSGH